ncbi:MAG: hypothetical protein ACRD22_18210 [Terriglobia bacterium]
MTIKWKTLAAKDDKNFALEGVEMKLIRVDGLPREIEISDHNGKRLRISGTYLLTVEVPEPPAMEKQFQIVGTIFKDVQIVETFKDLAAAERRKEVMEDHSDESCLRINEIEVPAEE